MPQLSDLSSSDSNGLLTNQPLSLLGRRPNKSTEVLRHFKNVRNPDKHPKLEYLRAFFIRLIKKCVRLTLTNKRSTTLLHKFGEFAEPLQLVKNLVSSSTEIISSSMYWDTKDDPACSLRRMSFNGAYCSEFYSSRDICTIHDCIILSIFKDPIPVKITSFLKIQVRDRCKDPKKTFKMLGKLLISDEFKGKTTDSLENSYVKPKREDSKVNCLLVMPVYEPHTNTQLRVGISVEEAYCKGVPKLMTSDTSQSHISQTPADSSRILETFAHSLSNAQVKSTLTPQITSWNFNDIEAFLGSLDAIVS